MNRIDYSARGLYVISAGSNLNIGAREINTEHFETTDLAIGLCLFTYDKKAIPWYNIF